MENDADSSNSDDVYPKLVYARTGAHTAEGICNSRAELKKFEENFRYIQACSYAACISVG